MSVSAPVCPHCGAQQSTQVGTLGRAPAPLDYSLCAACRLFSIFDSDDDGLVLRGMTVEEQRRLARNPRAAALQATLATQPSLRAAMESWRRHGASYG